LVYKSDGALYFTDPPFGLAKQDDDPAKELKFNAVYRFAKGKLQPIIKDLDKPNGLAFSPDEKTFYVANSGPKRLWMAYDVVADGSVSKGRVFADVSAEKETDVPDGMKVDVLGNILRHRAGRRMGLRGGRQALGYHQDARTPVQLQLGRRRQDALHHRRDGRVPHQARRGRREGVVSINSIREGYRCRFATQ